MPVSIFGIIGLIVFIFMILIIEKLRANRNTKRIILTSFFSFLIIVFSWIWFVPMHIGWNGEIPILRFRFQVFEYSSDDYGSVPELTSNIFDYKPSRYGRTYIQKRIGGIKEYFTFTPNGMDSYIEYEENEP